MAHSGAGSYTLRMAAYQYDCMLIEYTIHSCFSRPAKEHSLLNFVNFYTVNTAKIGVDKDGRFAVHLP